MPQRIIRMDSQILNRVCECPRKASLFLVMGYKPAIQDDDISIGSLVHLGLECHYKEIQKGELSYDAIVEKAIELMRKETLTSDISVEDSESVIKTYLEYSQFRRGESWRPIEVEQPFSKVLFESDEIMLLYEGVIDLVFEDIEIDLGIADHKKQKQDRQVSMSPNQFKGYSCALGIRNVVVNKIGFQKTLPPERKFNRVVLSYPKELIYEWERTAIYHGLRYAHFLEIGEFPPNFNSCDLYKGCMFRRVCNATPEVRMHILNTEYRIGELWDPFKKQKIESD
jgi:hypothetical protein